MTYDAGGRSEIDATTDGPAMMIGLPVLPSGGCGTKGGAGRSGCGSAAGSGDLAPEVWEKVRTHPCYSEQAHHHFARMHIAVAPACNMQCNYCNRKYDCANESRPGVVSERLTPEQAARKVLAVAAKIPQMTVVGIAGPGDPLANPARTFRTFELIAEAAPDLRLCLSTNGLALPDHLETIARLGIDHVTITINMIDPDIGAAIYPWVFYGHRRVTGRAASELLAERQLRGLEMLTARGILAKINSVMIPGINDTHLREVNRAVKSRGAFLHNIMPLIASPEHGTVFGLSGQRGPSAGELKALQDSCEGDMNMMRHCRQCRADAVGMLGEDRGAEFAVDAVPEVAPAYDAAARRAWQDKVQAEQQAEAAAKQAALNGLAGEAAAFKVLVAVATKGGGRINEHFGHAREFQVYEVGAAGAKFVGHRRVDLYCQGGQGKADALQDAIRAINDCTAVFVAKIGACPKSELLAAGIRPVDDFAYEFIEQSALVWFKDYLERVRRGDVKHSARGDAAIRQGAFTAG